MGLVAQCCHVSMLQWASRRGRRGDQKDGFAPGQHEGQADENRVAALNPTNKTVRLQGGEPLVEVRKCGGPILTMLDRCVVALEGATTSPMMTKCGGVEVWRCGSPTLIRVARCAMAIKGAITSLMM